MISSSVRGLTVAALVVGGLVAPVPAQAETRQCAAGWKVTEFPMPKGTTSKSGIDETDGSGRWMVGAGEKDGQQTVIRWHDGVPEELSAPDATRGWSVNSSGTVTGGGGLRPPWRWTTSGAEFLPLPPGRTYAYAYHINDAGDVAGWVGKSGPILHWPGDNPDAVRELHGSLKRRTWSVIGVDNAGRVVGGETWAGEPAIGYVWDRAGGRVELKPLPGHASTFPQAVSNGRIVGVSATGDVADGPTVEWDAEGKVMRRIDDRPLFVWDVNAGGDVLATTNVWGGEAGVWTVSGTFLPMPAGGEFYAISDAGEVFGVMFKDDSAVPVKLTWSDTGTCR